MKKGLAFLCISILSCICTTAKAATEDTVRYCIDPVARRQTMEGWGVSLCWWANMCGKWSDDKIDQLVDWLVSPTGLNYNIFRYNIGGGDDPLNRNCTLHHMASGKGLRAEMEGFKQYETDTYDWTRDAAQRKIMLKIKEKRPDAIFEAFSNSAPYYMTYSGCCAGAVNANQDNLKPAYYEAFAHYLVDVCKHYKDTYGIEFKTLEPFNEPVSNYWKSNGGQEGCHFSNSAMVAFVKVLSPILNASGLNTVISASDETDIAKSLNEYQAFKADAEAFATIKQWNTHSYWGDNKARTNLRASVQADGLPLWMSETGEGGEGISGNLNVSQRLMNDLKYMVPQAWIDWQYVEEYNDQWCMVRGVFADATYERVKNYYVRQQVTRFIRQGYTLLSVLDDHTLAALSPGGDSLVIVSQNNTADNVRYKVDLSLFGSTATKATCFRTSSVFNCIQTGNLPISDNALAYTIMPYSIATLIIPVADPDEAATWRTDRPYLVVPRCTSLVMQANSDGLSIEEYTPNDSTQLWMLVPNGANYELVNLKNERLTDTGGYYLSTSTSATSGQQFQIETIEDGVVKLTSTSTNKALDLEGENSAAGTKVGVWAYGSSPTATHRQWLLLEAPYVYEASTGISDLVAQTPFCHIHAADGFIFIVKDENTAHISIFGLDGSKVHDSCTRETLVRRPLSKGIYVVSVVQGGKKMTEKVKVN